ncbi:hypothetical protein AGLY_006737 [Aphis glycines]|uniref:Uncharacterized protein n=1 Tax=Aphis glycines TaxID=307491 RepID=A0A6G0TQ78_APHGL|nr:hypothetical protein AGLY_006737 [Aphis glycines]
MKLENDATSIEKIISKMLEGEEMTTEGLPEDFNIDDITFFKYAPITSVEVERRSFFKSSFDVFKFLGHQVPGPIHKESGHFPFNNVRRLDSGIINICHPEKSLHNFQKYLPKIIYIENFNCNWVTKSIRDHHKNTPLFTEDGFYMINNIIKNIQSKGNIAKTQKKGFALKPFIWVSSFEFWISNSGCYGFGLIQVQDLTQMNKCLKPEVANKLY